MKHSWLLALGVSSAILAPAVMAADASANNYPNRSIRLLVGYSPAGAADLVGRIFGEALGQQLGQPVVIENRPGAGSTLASRALAQAEPDGYTLALASGTLYGIDQFLYKMSYAASDFTPLMRLTVSPLVLAVNKATGISTVPELIETARANPGKLNYSSSGIGGSPHVAAVMFEQAVDAAVTHVPYKGGAPALQAVGAGHVEFSFGTAASVLPLAQQGSVRMLGVSTREPSAVAPGLQPLDQLGLPGFDFSFWFGLFGPAGLPENVQTKLLDATFKALADEDVRARMLATGNEVAPMASQQAFAQWAQENGTYVLERVKKANIELK